MMRRRRGTKRRWISRSRLKKDGYGGVG